LDVKAAVWPQTSEGPIEQGAEPPFVSVIMPVRNEEAYIRAALVALAKQDYPRDRFEVIVLDGESSDSTLLKAEATAREYGIPDAFLTNHRRTTASSLNMGLALARGDVIIHLDGHTEVQQSFVSESVSALRQSQADAAGGTIRTVGRGAVGKAIALAMSSPFGVGDASFRVSQEEQWAETVPFAAYRREVFARIGGFAEDIDRGEDDEFNYRLRDQGGRIWMTPSIRTDYYARSTYGALMRQYFGYGIAKVDVLRRHPARLRLRHLVPPLFVLVVWGSAVMSLIDGVFFRILGLTAATYVASNLVASLHTAIQGHWRVLPYLPAAFASIHLAAGAGMLAGAVRALRTRRKPRAP
jgi:cellulose synthase/poly-beta-1,6-N-acetylglucosamine synthase-like glycosyltransferase